MSWFALGSLAAWVVVVVLALVLRSRAYALFRGVQLGLHALIAVAVAPAFAAVFPVFACLHGLVYFQSLALVRPRLRPLWYRALVSWPAAFFSAGTLLALPWAVCAMFGWQLPLVWLPYVLAFVGIVQSLTVREEQVDVVVADGSVQGLRRHTGGAGRVGRPLRLVQITDPHLGPFMSVQRLRCIVESAVRRDPDLVLLTGTS